MANTTQHTTQINFRLPVDIKELAFIKAQSMGTNLSEVVKHFLTQFVYSDAVVKVDYVFDRDKILDDGIRSYANSPQGQVQMDNFSTMLEEKKL